jgi:hypothetical protein
MENEDNHQFHFDRKNYFLRFIPNENEQQYLTINKNLRHALEYFVDDIRADRNKTIERFLNEQTVNDIFRSIAQLLLNNDERYEYQIFHRLK